MTPQILCDLRSSFGDVRNQGSRPTCIAFAVSDAHAVARGGFQILSVEHLYYHAVRRTPSAQPQDGVSMPVILDALRHDGQAAELGWPYVDPLPADLAAWKPPPSATPIFKRETVAGVAMLDRVIRHLDAGTPVVVTLMVSQSFCTAEHDVIAEASNDPDVAWHAVVAVGHGKRSSRRALLIRNSWGVEWGLGGYCWLDEGYVAARVKRFAAMSATGSV